MSHISIGRLLKRGWMLLVVVVAVAGFCVYRLHGIFGLAQHDVKIWSASFL